MTAELSIWNACGDTGRKLYDAWERIDWDAVRDATLPTSNPRTGERAWV